MTNTPPQEQPAETMTVERNGQEVELDSGNKIEPRDIVPLSRSGKMTYVPSLSGGITFLRKSEDPDRPTIRRISYAVMPFSIKGGRLFSPTNPIMDALYEPADGRAVFQEHSYESLERELEKK